MSETDYVTRSEYETRHSELRTEMIGLRASDDSLRRDVMSRFDVFAAKMETASEVTNKKIEALDAKIGESRDAGWKIATMSLLNLVAGVVMGYLAHLLPFTK